MADPKTRIIISAVDQTKFAFTSARRNLSDLAGAGDKLGKSLGGIGSALGSLTGAGGLVGALTGGGLIALTKQVADQADALSKLSQKTGVAVEDLSRLQYAASLNDATNEQLEVSLSKLAKGMAETAAGAGEAKAGFDALGLTQDIQARKFANAGELFAAVSERLSQYADGANKSAIAQKIFGESGAALIPLLNSGAAGLKEMGDESDRLGRTMSTELAEASAEFNDNLTRMQASVDGAKIALGEELLPAISSIIDAMRDGIPVIADFARFLGESVAKAVAGSADPVERLDDKLGPLKQRLADINAELGRTRLLRINPFSSDGALAREALEIRLEIERLEKIRAEFVRIANSASGKPDPSSGKPTVPADGRPQAPALAGTGGKPKTTREDLNAGFDVDAAQAYAGAVKQIGASMIEAEKSGRDLNAAQSVLYDLMRSPEWERMPEPWRQTAIAQAASATETIRAAEEQRRLNDLIAATPTAVLDRQRETMQFLADAYLAGKIGAKEFEEATTTALGNVAEKTEESTDLMQEFGKQAARNMQSAFADFLFDPFQDGLDGMLAGFGQMLQRMIAEAVAADLANRIMGPKGDGKGGWLDLALTAASAYFGGGGGTSTAPANISRGGSFSTSFDGGGFTGDGPRSGGIDGKGGFLAVLHPRETVLDHTKGQRMGQSINITVNVASGTPAEVRRAAGAGAREALGAFSGAQRYA